MSNKIILAILSITILFSCQSKSKESILKSKGIDIQRMIEYATMQYSNKYNLKSKCNTKELFGDSTYIINNIFNTANPFSVTFGYGECSKNYLHDYTKSDDEAVIENYRNGLKNYKLYYHFYQNGIEQKVKLDCQEVEVTLIKNNKVYKNLIQITPENESISFVCLFYFN